MAPVAGLAIGHARMNSEYGDTPRIGVQKDPANEGCQVITSVAPKARYDWRGKTWQDVSLGWETIRIEMGFSGSKVRVSHENRGPIETGDKVCGLDSSLPVFWIYEPEGIILRVVE